MAAGWTIRIADPDAREIAFALNAAFGAARVGGADVVSVATAPAPGLDGLALIHAVALHPSRDGADRIVKIAYAGPLFPDRSSVAVNTLDADKVELTADSFWFPFDASFGARLTADIQIRVAGDWQPVAAGRIDRTPVGYRLRQDRPALDIAVSLLSSSVRYPAQDWTIFDARREPGTKIPELKAALNGCAAYLNALAGPAGPLPPASIIVTGRAEASYARGTLISLSDIENEGEEALRQFICHELAHYWSRAHIGGPDNWINEGVADHLANMAVREALGEAVYAARLVRYRDWLNGYDLPPVWTAGATVRPPHLVLYRKAPLLLAELENRVGRKAFAAFMQALMANPPVTTRDFLNELERVAGTPTKHWFEAKLAE
ncbi:hypothetical protein [uncultured Algimonas sp.]|uniref:hypothetical protein n=1 Tax=uncultured Algimonas sp. TaxID=1547920 RepID=UPI00263395AE|nr:hypothetical protein [uncultured Algimonas sp.]